MRQLCLLHELAAGTATLARLETRDFLLYRADDNTVHVYLNRCPHLGIPLVWQPAQLWDKAGRHLQCSAHGALFIPSTGECISGPCQGDSLWAVTCSIVEGAVLIDDSELPSMVQINQ
jgi:nitrite reductase/ring-hydroxylating ferredoxin subunit